MTTKHTFIKYKLLHKPLILIFLLLSTLAIEAQKPENISKSSIKVAKSDKSFYKYPWAGGLNSCQAGAMDLNLDGIKDLIAFDRIGNRLLTFTNNGTPNTIDYEYAPEYESLFPDFTHWVIFIDYNNDGKEDIYTYNPAFPGIIVYKNVSDTELKFELVAYPYLTSFYGSGQVNILVTMVDYPGISDLDNDGDLDILTFWALGAFVEYHKNMSMEIYGVPDSFNYVREEYCWGQFAESEESNTIYLDTCFGQKTYPSSNNFQIDAKDRHTGSTFLLIDIDNDQDKDLLLGDIDYPNLPFLHNGGTPEDAYMSSYTMDFPEDTRKVNLFSLPVASHIDINNDQVKDLLISPFDPNPYTIQNYKSVWFYKNEGTEEIPSFQYKQERFLQDEMIDLGSGAYPVLADYNMDGLKDLFIGNYGYYDSSNYDEFYILHSYYSSRISLFTNNGTLTDPVFELVTEDLGYVSDLAITGASPALGDLDGDEDLDMLVGRDDGTLMYYNNCSCTNSPEDYILVETNYQDIDVGDYSTPQLIDLNGDGLPDLVVGEKGGNLNYYENNGTIEVPIFNYVTDSLGKVNVADYNISYDGFSTPKFFTDQNDEMKLVVGSFQGKMFYFENITNNLDGEFTESDLLYELIAEDPFTIKKGFRTSPAIAEINNDEYLDLLVGNFSGGIELYSVGSKPPVPHGVNDIGDNDYASVIIFPNPAIDHINIRFNNNVGSCLCRIFDISGNKIIEFPSGTSGEGLKIPTTNLSQGIYILQLTFFSEKGAKAIHKKFVVF